MSLDAALDAAFTERLTKLLEPLVDALNRVDHQLEPLVYTAEQAASVLQVSPPLVRQWVKRGVLPRLPEIATILIPIDDVKAFVGEAKERQQARTTRRAS